MPLVTLSINAKRVMVSLYTMTPASPGRVDHLDAALIELLAAEPRVGVLEASRRLRVARGTVQARLDRLQDRGVITGYGPEVDPAALGYEVTAFITLEIRQAGGHDPVAERLAAIPEVLEAHTITGAGDMLCRVVARSNADLQRVIDAIVSTEGVVRSATLISLATQVPYRVLPLIRAAAGHGLLPEHPAWLIGTPIRGIARPGYVPYGDLTRIRPAGGRDGLMGGNIRSWMCRPARAGTRRVPRPQIWRSGARRASPAASRSSPASPYCPGCSGSSARWCSRRPSGRVVWARRMSPRTRCPNSSTNWSWVTR
jgi:DNA-binding Lrp family transcriptional regulator